MNRFKRSLGVGFVFTLYIMCFYYAFAVLQALAEHGDVVKAAADSLVVGVVMFVFITFGIYELLGWAEERRKLDDELRRERENRDNGAAGKDDNDRPTQ